MNCARIREAFLTGSEPSPADVQAHLEQCSPCRELFQHEGELGRSLAEDAALSADFSEPSFEQLSARVDRERGVRAWFRSRPTPQRFAFLATVVLLVVVGGGALRHRQDLSQYSLLRMGVLLGGYLALVLFAIYQELSRFAPVAGSPWSHLRGFVREYPWLLLGALAVPFAAALVPATEASRAAGPGGALACFAYGVLLTLPIGVLVWAANRDDRLSTATVWGAAVALGLSADLVLELHCASGNPWHLLAGHASIGIAWLAAWSVARRASRA